ncbi:MAG: F0F1 ATP synthase subunit delta [Candidatus Taylorbacteria bacterium]|nr:F0F1 ATP synthase subunit delta [Candidatus Taylorbacteria bacterium]
MRYPPPHYAKYLMSLRSLPAGEQRSSLKKLVEMLQKSGDIKEWQRILDIYESLVQKMAGKKKAVVTYSGTLERQGIEKALSNYDIVFVEDKTVLGGVSIRVGDTRIENTMRGRLAGVKRALMQN